MVKADEFFPCGIDFDRVGIPCYALFLSVPNDEAISILLLLSGQLTRDKKPG